MPGPFKRILLTDRDHELALSLAFACTRRRLDWEVSVAPSGDEALDRLPQMRFDAIIADTSVPGGGIELLQAVAERHPQIARIILSDQPNDELMLKALGVAHQYLAKPCALQELIATVARLGTLDHFFTKDPLRRVANRIRQLPSPPTVCFRLTKELARPEATTESVGAVIAQDANLTARLLQLANSAFFKPDRPVVKVSEAVQVLGFNLVKSLALSLGLATTLEAAPIGELSPERLYRHSLGTGLLAQTIARDQGADPAAIDAAFTAGVLHDTGKLIFASALPELYTKAVRLAADELIPQWEAEDNIIGAGHAEIGAYLLGLWGLPAPIVEAVAWHHEPRRHDPNGSNVLAAIHVADFLESRRLPASHRHLVVKIDEPYVGSLGLNGRIEEWAEMAGNLA